MADNIFKRIINKSIDRVIEKRALYWYPTTSLGLPYTGYTGTPLEVETALKLSAVYRCVEVVSDAIASQPFEVQEYDKSEGWVVNEFNSAGYMLNYEPSPLMSRFTMMKTLISKVLLEGNGYLIINRNNYGDPVSLNLVNASVKIFVNKDGTLTYTVEDIGRPFDVAGEDMIHVLNYSYDGLVGVSVLTHAVNSTTLAVSAEATATGFFSSGANMSGIISSEGKLTQEKADAIKASWAKSFDKTLGTPGGIAVMEGGLTFHPVTVNPKDAQMLETRKFNVIDICRFFGVHPSKVFDDSNLTYSNIESFQLGFITDTVSPLDCKIEAEFNRKLLRPSKRLKTRLNLNIEELMRANLDTKANYYSKMFQCGNFTVNEIRTKTGQPKVKGGDKAYIPLNMIPVDTPITKNTKIDKNINVKDKDNAVDEG